MPTALERLLAKPSALRALKSIVAAPELSPACLPSLHCYARQVAQSNSRHNEQFPENESQAERGPQALRGNLTRRPPSKTPLDHIDFQSDVAGPCHANLKVDQPEYRNDYNFWVELLQYRERVYGANGIREIWIGMRNRGVDLPTTPFGRTATLWGTFIKNKEIVLDVLNYGGELFQRTGEKYEHLYKLCMAHWMARHSRLARRCHHVMIDRLELSSLPLRELAQYATQNKTTLLLFRMIYQWSDEQNVYDSIVPRLCEQGNIKEARRWHYIFLNRQDYPSPEVAADPEVVFLTKEYQTSLLSRVLERTSAKPDIYADERTVIESPPKKEKDESQDRTKVPRFNREFMNLLLGEAHHVTPKKFDDAFCARLFATRAFSPASVIKGLSIFGVDAVGPLALREMGLRSDLNDLPTRFRELKEARISVGTSVFARALERYSRQKNTRLVRQLLDSDQHPDVLEDRRLQKELLNFYISKEDWNEVYRTLAILTIHDKDPVTASWNRLLQYRIKHHQLDQITQLLEDMRINGIPVTQYTIKCFFFDILRPRSPSKRPITRWSGEFDDLRFLTKCWLTILESGIHIPPGRWREVLRRYGMTWRLHELRRLVHWLLAWYSPSNYGTVLSSSSLTRAHVASQGNIPTGDPSTTHSKSHKLHVFAQLFPPSFQVSVIEWGFLAGLSKQSTHEISMISPNLQKRHYIRRYKKKGVINRVNWKFGLELVAELRDAGVLVHTDLVRKVLKRRLYILYGPGRQSSRKINRVIAEDHTLEFRDMCHEAEKVWGKKLFYFQEPIAAPVREELPSPPKGIPSNETEPCEIPADQREAASAMKSLGLPKEKSSTRLDPDAEPKKEMGKLVVHSTT